jgi:hypothetical protein
MYRIGKASETEVDQGLAEAEGCVMTADRHTASSWDNEIFWM